MGKSHKYGSNIPEARDELIAIADEMLEGDAKMQEYAARIEVIVFSKMYRDQPTRRGRRSASHLSPEVVAAIEKDLLTSNMNASEIAAKHGVNGGRVSEIAKRMRTEGRL
jgi:hypothetical protein